MSNLNKPRMTCKDGYWRCKSPEDRWHTSGVGTSPQEAYEDYLLWSKYAEVDKPEEPENISWTDNLTKQWNSFKEFLKVKFNGR